MAKDSHVTVRADAGSFVGVLSVNWDKVLKVVYGHLAKAGLKYTVRKMMVIRTQQLTGYSGKDIASKLKLEVNLIEAINADLDKIFPKAGIYQLELTADPYDSNKDAIPACAACCCDGNGVSGLCCPC